MEPEAKLRRERREEEGVVKMANMKVSKKRPLESFWKMGMTGSGLKRHRNQAVTGLTLLTFFAVTLPTPAQDVYPTKFDGWGGGEAQPTLGQGTRTTHQNQVGGLIAQIPLLPPNLPPGGLNTLPPETTIPVPIRQTPTGRPRINQLPPDTPYTLGAGDRIKIDVFDVPEYSGEYVVLVDGTLNLPVIGSVTVRGRSLEEASNDISERYRPILKRPIVTLSLLIPRPVNLAVAGEVLRPGTYTVSPGSGSPGNSIGQFPRVTQAITLAGGITQSANIHEVKLRRRTFSGTGQEDYYLDLWSLIQEGNLAQDVVLRDGDTLIISAVTTVNPLETRQLADASFAPKEIQPINISVIGEVGRPGPYVVTGGGSGTGGATAAITGGQTGPTGGTQPSGSLPTVTRAIQVAGGITSLADIRSITIRRTPRQGEVQVIQVNLWELLHAGDISQDVILQDGDTITIPTATAIDEAEANQLAAASFSPNTIVVNVVGEVPKPGATSVPPNTPLNQAILAAGGFNIRARKLSVDLIRLNPNGTVTKREIPVDLAQGINEEGNPTLRNNDVVVVRRSRIASIGDTLTTILNPIGSLFGLFNFLTIFK